MAGNVSFFFLFRSVFISRSLVLLVYTSLVQFGGAFFGAVLVAAAQWIPPAAVGAVVSVGVTGSTAAEPPVPHRLGVGVRKDRTADVEDEDRAEAGPPYYGVETLGTLYNTHTGDATALSRDEPEFARFSDMLADRVTLSRIDLDERLLGLLRRIAARNPGVRIELSSGYRSPKLNEMLRKKGHHVASHSQHSLGHAVDFRLVGMKPREMKEQVIKAGWNGGIGQYDKESDNFVHADVGAQREWFEGKGP